MAYSLDVRERIVATVKEGAKQPEVAERFKVSLSSVERYLRLAREGELRAKPPPGRPATIAATAYGALAEQITQHNDASLKEHCELWLEEQGTSVSVYAMCRAMKRAGLSRKKRP
jgi:transposase